MYNFLTRMEPGDTVVVRDGATLHFGQVTGAPEYLASSPGDDYRRRRTVDWLGHCDLPDTARGHIIARTAVQLVDTHRPLLLKLMAGMPDLDADPVGCVGLPYQPAVAADVNAAEILPSAPDTRLLEFAIHAHVALQNNLAAEAAQRGLSVRLPGPGEPPYDLAWLDELNRLTVCEVKSLTPENEVAQLRTGIGQLLDYANDLRDVEEVLRVLWVQYEPCRPDHWFQVCTSANIILAWPGEEDRVLGSGEE